jgi:hypothetical protein
MIAVFTIPSEHRLSVYFPRHPQHLGIFNSGVRLSRVEADGVAKRQNDKPASPVHDSHLVHLAILVAFDYIVVQAIDRDCAVVRGHDAAFRVVHSIFATGILVAFFTIVPWMQITTG